MHVVYILKSEVTGRFYCGETQNLKDRLERHNGGRSKYTKHGIPWVLVKTIECQDRTQARLLERKIKSRGINRWLEDGY